MCHFFRDWDSHVFIIVAPPFGGLYCHIGKFLHQVHGISRLSAWDQIGITSIFPSLASTAPNVGLKVLSAEMGIQALEAASLRFHVPRYSVPWCLSSKLGSVGKIRSYVGYTCYIGVSIYMSFINVEGKQQKCSCFLFGCFQLKGLHAILLSQLG